MQSACALHLMTLRKECKSNAVSIWLAVSPEELSSHNTVSNVVENFSELNEVQFSIVNSKLVSVHTGRTHQ